MKKLFRRLLSPIVKDTVEEIVKSIQKLEYSSVHEKPTPDYTPEIVHHTLIDEAAKNVTKKWILSIVENGLLEFPHDHTFDEVRIFIHLSESQKAHKSADQ